MFDGSLTTIRAHERGADGEFNPTYRCLFPEPPPPGTVPACAEAGVMGALAGILGSMMALEAIREIVGFGESLVGRLVMVDARAMRFETLRYARDPANPLNGDTPIDHRFERTRGLSLIVRPCAGLTEHRHASGASRRAWRADRSPRDPERGSCPAARA